jgi:hypothetical protein
MRAESSRRILKELKIMETFEQLRLTGCGPTESCQGQSPCYPRDSRASHTALRAKVLAMVTAATCGASVQESSANFARVGSSVKIRQVFSQGQINDTSVEYLTTYPCWGIVLAGETGALAMSVPGTEESAFLSSRSTEEVPTPCASDGRASRHWKRGQFHLNQFAEMFPTPLASDARRVLFSETTLKKVREERIRRKGKWGPNLAESVMVSTDNGKLNPTWVEWLMGFPLGWTDCAALATPSCPRKSSRSLPRSPTSKAVQND